MIHQENHSLLVIGAAALANWQSVERPRLARFCAEVSGSAGRVRVRTSMVAGFASEINASEIASTLKQRAYQKRVEEEGRRQKAVAVQLTPTTRTLRGCSPQQLLSLTALDQDTKFPQRNPAAANFSDCAATYADPLYPGPARPRQETRARPPSAYEPAGGTSPGRVGFFRCYHHAAHAVNRPPPPSSFLCAFVLVRTFDHWHLSTTRRGSSDPDAQLVRDRTRKSRYRRNSPSYTFLSQFNAHPRPLSSLRSNAVHINRQPPPHLITFQPPTLDPPPPPLGAPQEIIHLRSRPPRAILAGEGNEKAAI
ncbi:hypothetical protein R3P38DRAFT_2795426 [Favolaschia claudopus]|uniref:Uncharacterized protein n=1 Tax=Favolaschia claudopus TaxID=2862362 RepID=A0AAW0A741_9AGAR